ncbi:hypothetical protein OA93_05470 [Flavobacterium sp. KMS]|jgi:hypothetical protein|uniref:hypothetical protein n=1 Tax=Flavobacterium sp. KMS TaxID=1566023 RepID=UPI00057C399F|nr:hypothetical protein [Flavobacterium sp. KMS]KIA99598.1 hypothetical protein OA93_05470 [Flavobacterium sp. KMS]
MNREIKTFDFFQYKPFAKDSANFSFLAKLAALKMKGHREQIQNEAIAYIEGVAPYELQYIFNPNELQGNIGKFKSFYNVLNKETDFTKIIEQTCLFFDTNVDDFSRYLISDSYLENKERLWESYFALIIEMGFQNENRTAIIKVIGLCNFLETTFNHLDDSQLSTTLDTAKLVSLFNANVILDKDIFPLPSSSYISFN